MIKTHEDTDSHSNKVFFYGDTDNINGTPFHINFPIPEHVLKNIMGWNYDTNNTMVAEITSYDIVTKNQWVKIHMKLSKDDIVSEIATTADTKVLLYSETVGDDKWITSSDLKVGDLLMGIPGRNGLYKLITNIEVFEEPKTFAKINTNVNGGEYVCNGIWLKDS